MSKSWDSLTAVIRDVFEDETLEVTRETTAHDVDGWDSLMHVELMMQVESTFGVRFTSTEVADLQSVGDLADLVDQKSAHE